MAKKILLVDDEAELCFMLSRFLQRYGYDVMAADNASRALELADGASYDAIILDVNLADLAGRDGSNLMAAMKKKYPQTPIILYTGMTKEDVEVKDMLDQGAFELVSKATPLETLLKAVQRAENAGANPPKPVRSK
jgi:two-component system response regulator HydG